MAFSEGDMVQLKSGGPKMTVVHINHVGAKTYYECKWFAGSKLSNGSFSAESIQPYKEPAEKKKA